MEKLCRQIGLTLFLAIVAVGCSDEPAEPVQDAGEVMQVMVMNHPLMYFVRRLTGDSLEVKLLAPAGTDPALWAPEVADVLMLQAADLVLLNGAGYEGWLDKVSISAGKLVDTSAGFRDRWIRVEDQVTHSHGPQGEHSHGSEIGHTILEFHNGRRCSTGQYGTGEAYCSATALLQQFLFGGARRARFLVKQKNYERTREFNNPIKQGLVDWQRKWGMQ